MSFINRDEALLLLLITPYERCVARHITVSLGLPILSALLRHQSGSATAPTRLRGGRITIPGIVAPLPACGPAGGSVAKGMKKISYCGYRFPPEIIQQAIWLYLRFTLSLRDVEDLLAERGFLDASQSPRCARNRSGPAIELKAEINKNRKKS